MDAGAGPTTDEGLLGLHQALERDGFVVGPRELLSATRLLVELAKAGLWGGGDAARLKTYLGAVYCKSAAEQKRFGGVFDAWLKARSQAAPERRETREEVAPPPASEPPAPPPERPWRKWAQHTAVALVVVAIAAPLLLQSLRDRAAAPAPVDQATTPVEPAASAAPGPAPASAPRTAPAEAGQPDGNAGYEAQHQLQRELQPWLVAVLVGLPAPLLLLLYAPALALSRRHVERQRRGAGVLLDVSVWRSEAERVVPVMSEATAARLDRHVLPPAEDAGMRRLLHPARTIAATLRRHGQLTLRWRARRTRPTYLVLIDVRDENDLRGRLFFRWADRLRRQGVGVDIWLFDGDPRRLYPAHQRRIVDTQGGERNAVRFEQVAQRAAADSVSRLIVVGDGSSFFADGELAPWWPTLGWERWPERVMFTPVDSRDWGDREVAIERPMARADPGFLVLPLEAEALDAYAVLLTSGELPAIVLSAARRYPSLLERLPDGGLATEAPPEKDIEKLIAQLRLYLGENGLRWLAACAVPPLTRWELTLLIGQELFRSMGADDEESLRWLMQTHYARLARLPWLRSASFPDWLALRLLAELSPPEQQRIRDVVSRLLDQVPAERVDTARDVLPLDCTPPGGGGAADSAPPNTTPNTPPNAPPDPSRQRRDWLYLGFLDGLSPRQLAMRAPPAWRKWFAAPRGPARGARELLRFAAEWLRAFAARLMWRDGRRESGSSWRPLALSSLWIALTAGALAWAASRPEGELPSSLAELLLVDRRSDAGAVSEVPYRQLAFSGDGSHFVSVDASGEIQVRRSDPTASLVGPPIQMREPIAAVFLDEKGERLFVVERGGRVRRIDPRTGGRGDWLQFDSGMGYQGAVLSSDSRYLVGWDAGGGVWLSDLEKHSTKRLVEEQAGAPVPSVAFATNGIIVARGNATWTFRLDSAQAFSGEVPGAPANARTWISTNALLGAAEIEKGRLRIMGAATSPRSQDLGFSGDVTHCVFSASTARVAAAAGTEIKVWDNGKVIATLTARQGKVRQLALPGDGSVLLVADEGNEVQAYKLPGAADVSAKAGTTEPADSGAPVPLPSLATGSPLAALAVSPQGDRVLTANDAHEVRLWQSARLGVVAGPTVQNAKGWRTVAISADGRWAASSGDNGEVVVWDIHTGQLRSRFNKGQTDKTLALAFSDSGQQLNVLSESGTWQAWDLRRAVTVGPAVPDPGGEHVLEGYIPGRTGLTVTADGARFWRFGDLGAQLVRQFKLSGLQYVELNIDGTLYATSNSAGQVSLWSMETGQGLRDFDAASDLNGGASSAAQTAQPVQLPLPSVVGQPLDKARATLTALGLGLNVSGSNAPTRALPGTVLLMNPAAGTRVSRGSTVQLVAAGSTCRGGFVERKAFAGDPACVDAATRDQVQRDNKVAESRIALKSQAFGAGTTCLSGYVWREADRLVRGNAFTDKVCVLPEERQQAADDNARQKERLAEGFGYQVARVDAQVQALGPDKVLGLSLATNATGSPLLLVRGERRVLAYDTTTGRPLGPAVTQRNLTSVAFAPQQALLLTAGADGTVRFWDAASGQESLPALRVGGPVIGLGFMSDGRHLLTLQDGGNARVWDLQAQRALPSPTEYKAAIGRVDTFAFDPLGERIVLVGGTTSQAVTLPTPDTGDLRVIRPYAQFWLAVLTLIVATSIAGMLLSARRRAGRIAAITLGARSARIAALRLDTRSADVSA